MLIPLVWLIITVTALKKIIIPYSAINNKANPTEAYSILKPETNSDSPSEKSKGVRFVSATQDNNHKTSKGINVKIIKK